MFDLFKDIQVSFSKKFKIHAVAIFTSAIVRSLLVIFCSCTSEESIVTWQKPYN